MPKCFIQKIIILKITLSIRCTVQSKLCDSAASCFKIQSENMGAILIFNLLSVNVYRNTRCLLRLKKIGLVYKVESPLKLQDKPNTSETMDMLVEWLRW